MVKTQVTEFFISPDLKFEMNFPLFPFSSRFSATRGSFWLKNNSKAKLSRLFLLSGFQDTISREISFFKESNPLQSNKK